MKVLKTKIPGCYELLPKVHHDDRGVFVKTFHVPSFQKLGLAVGFVEEYYSVSNRNVLRGLHFQVPPHDHVKLVYCVQGAIWDVALDLRRGSPTYLQHVAIELSAEKANMVYLPRGLAHGFCVLEAPAIVVYKVTSVYASEHDQGVRWDSAGIEWPVQDPVLSERDRAFPSLEEFDSPFRYAS